MMVDINRVIVENRIRTDYGNLQELANDIQENGLINPPVVTPDFKLIAGERRYKAMQLLGWPQIEVRVMSVKDALHQLKLEISENENRKDFSFSEKMQWAKQLEEEYKRIAKENSIMALDSSSSGTNVPLGRVRDKVAEDVGIGSGKTYDRAKYVSEHADSDMIKALDDEQLSINAAYNKLKEKLQQQTNEYTTEAADLSSRLERQVRKNNDLETMITQLKCKGDPDLIKEIDKLNLQIRKDYEHAQNYRDEAARARKRAEEAEARAAKDRAKADEASADMNELLERLDELERKLEETGVQSVPPIDNIQGKEDTITALQKVLYRFACDLDPYLNESLDCGDNGLQVIDCAQVIISKLNLLQNSIKQVA